MAASFYYRFFHLFISFRSAHLPIAEQHLIDGMMAPNVIPPVANSIFLCLSAHCQYCRRRGALMLIVLRAERMFPKIVQTNYSLCLEKCARRSRTTFLRLLIPLVHWTASADWHCTMLRPMVSAPLMDPSLFIIYTTTRSIMFYRSAPPTDW